MKQHLNRLFLYGLLEFLPLISEPRILVNFRILKESEIIDSITCLPFFRLRFLILIPYNVLSLFIESESELKLCREEPLLLLLSDFKIRLNSLLFSSSEEPFIISDSRDSMS